MNFFFFFHFDCICTFYFTKLKQNVIVSQTTLLNKYKCILFTQYLSANNIIFFDFKFT